MLIDGVDLWIFTDRNMAIPPSLVGPRSPKDKRWGGRACPFEPLGPKPERSLILSISIVSLGGN